MNYADIARKAEEFGIPVSTAINHRIRFLRAEIERVRQLINGLELYEDAALYPFAEQRLFDYAKESLGYKREIDHLRAALIKKPDTTDDITDDMIERARSTPIETVIEFKRGVAHCLNPQHEDRHPSMYHAKRTNRAICPACGSKFDVIDAYQRVWGTNFQETVKRLS